MRQHYLKHGVVDDYSQNDKQKGITGFHLERWLKRALVAFGVPYIDDCCDNASVTRPVRYNKTDDVFEVWEGPTTGWDQLTTTFTAPAPMSAQEDGSDIEGELNYLRDELNERATIVAVPASGTSEGTAGQIAYDEDFMYVAIATNTWKRTPLESF